MAAFDTWNKKRAAIGFRWGRVLPNASGDFDSLDEQMLLRGMGQQALIEFDPPDPPEGGSVSNTQIGVGLGCGLG
jgi:hypothetical protein